MENLYFLLLLLPIVFLVLVGFEVYLRNPNHYENRVAAVNMLLLSLLFVADYAQSVLPPEYALPVAAYLKYPLVLLSAGTSFVLHLAIVRGKSRSLTYVGIGVAAVAAAYFGFAVSLGPDAFFTGATVESIWKTEHPTALTLFFLLPVGAVSIANTVISVAGYRKATAETDKKRMKILLRAHVSYFVSMLLVIPIIVFGSDAFVVPSIVQLLPTLVWGIAFRILMIHQDIFPSASSKYEALFRISPAAIVLLDSQGRIQEANSVASLLLGGGERQFLKGLSLMRFFPYEDKLLLLSGAAEQELKLVPLSGASKTVLLDTETMTTNGERFRLAVIRDITERKDAEKRTLHQAMHDPLTSLPNRLHFNKRLDEMLAKAESEGMRFAVAMIDMDRFKNINDTLGHQYGDEALTEIASRLSACVPEGALLARLGGDEFSVLLPVGDRSEALAFAETVIGRFEQPLTLLQQEFTIGASVGVCYYPEDGRTGAQLTKHADIAMYQAKTGGGNHCRTYSKEMKMAIYRNVELETFLRKALAKGELELHYQPQVDLRTLRVAGAEALLRWKCGTLGRVPPSEFIPVAESTGLIVDIGRWVLEQACMEAKRWEREGFPSMTISVNVSHRQLQQPDFVEMVKGIAANACLAPHRLCIEITESLLSRNLQSAVAMLDELAAWGARIAMDDFGTGYSSLAMLKRLPALGTIKIDRSFIDEMKEETEDRSMVSAIVWMSHALGKTVVAEGAETAEQVKKLQQMGCDAVQGYYFSKPLGPDQLLELLRRADAKANVG